MKNTNWKLLLVPFLALLLGMAGGCTDNIEELNGSDYGYVQFKLYKSASYGSKAVVLDRLSDAQKIEVELRFNDGRSFIQTLVLNAYDEVNSEYGMRSDKLQLLAGEYSLVSYKLLNRLDEEIVSVSPDSEEKFTVVSRGLIVKDLTVDTKGRGTVSFKLVKDGLTKAAGEYLFSKIRVADVTVMNTFTRETIDIKGLEVEYEEEYVENVNPYNPDDRYMDIGTAVCDSLVWIPAGTYQVTSYTTYSKTGTFVSVLETQAVSGEAFTVEDNRHTKDALVPVLLSETAEYIKDYKALKEIWEALDGKNWGYKGVGGTQDGANWNFNKEIDMWGEQPGVSIDNNGRVTSITLEGFGANGRVPDAIGQLTELRFLALGSHSETIGKLFNEGPETMSAEDREAIRMDYSRMFLDYDPRENMSEMLQEGINREPHLKKVVKSSRISPKSTDSKDKYSNNITFVSKAVMRLRNLEQFYMANSPFKAEDVCTDWENPESAYAKQWATESLGWSWSDLTELIDIELYNCPDMTRIPDFVFALPELQLLNVANNKGISADQLVSDWAKLASAPVGGKIQILYLGYNNLEKFPDDGSIRNMKKLGFLDCSNNRLKGRLEAFGSDVTLATLKLQYNEIEEIPDDFCGFTDQAEDLSFAHNKLKYIPNIFNAKSVYVMGSVDFSYNQIGIEGSNTDPASGEFRGINASVISLANNRISNFPTELFKAGSPITQIDLSNNQMTKIPKYSLRGKDGNYKNTHMLQIMDLRFNKLTELSEDFYASTLPYLTNIDLSYNCFSKFPTQPLDGSYLKAIGIRHQRDENGNRTLREWPEGITQCPSLIQLQIGSNDIRKVEEAMSPYLYILEIKDNPNITIDVTSVCAYIQAGAYLLIYDKTQDIRGCDALDIER